MPQLRIVSFGYGHSKPRPTCDLRLDARHLTDPYLDPALRDLDARDPRVQRAVMRTPGARALLSTIVTAGYALLAQAADEQTVTIAVGCGGGRHRAPVLAAQAAAQMDHLGDLRVQAVHRDLDEELLPAGAGDAAA
ncbi:RapZ C-terminal domain-containing protein [Streptomyces malaysiensis]|uniref:RapZ C-terminal domain-containing protein n=1 Tax=Streptomyces malaysiensis TaxID=92644 RepID=UPI000BFE4C27|nr:RNase adapter RapZ [Streptomyces malaysiensis]ATL88785.1 ATP-binding protein [Streptomyces malaysiensis]